MERDTKSTETTNTILITSGAAAATEQACRSLPSLQLWTVVKLLANTDRVPGQKSVNTPNCTFFCQQGTLAQQLWCSGQFHAICKFSQAVPK